MHDVGLRVVGPFLCRVSAPLGELPDRSLAVWLLASVVTWLGHPQGLVQSWLFLLRRLSRCGWGGGVAWGESLSSSCGRRCARLARLRPGQTRLTT